MDTDLNNVALVVAVAENNVIGRGGNVPWKLSSDLRRFKDITTGHSVIMGRKTWESIVNRLGSPLPGRTNIVVTRQANYRANGARLCGSLEDAIASCRPDRPAFVIGGAEIFQQALPLAQRIHLTLVHADVEGDALFPHFKGMDFERWTMTNFRRFPKDKHNEHDYTFAIYERRPHQSFVCLSNAREPRQWSLMEKIFVAGTCPFCPPFISDYHKQPIIMENNGWILTTNQWPYENTRVHLLAIHREHAERLADLTDEDWCDLGQLMRCAEVEYQIAGGGLALRFGNPDYNGGTVKHLHVQLMTADITDQTSPLYKPVRLRLG